MRAKITLALMALAMVGCGGGGGGGGAVISPPIAAVPPIAPAPTPIPIQAVEVYLDPDGGDLNVGFTPDSLPSWISRNGNGYKASAVENCSNRRAEIKGGGTTLTVIQTSKLQCNEPDLVLATNWNLLEKVNFWWKEQSGLLFTAPQADWPKKRGGNQFKFEVKYGDCGGTDCTRLDGTRDRSEIGVAFEPANPNDLQSWKPDPNREVWYSFSFYIPKPYFEQGDQAGTSGTTSFHQIMNTFENNGVREWYPMVMLAKENNGPMVARTYPTSSPYKVFKLIDDKDFEGHWHDVMIRYKASTTNGILQIWVNGSLKVDYADRTVLNTNTNIYAKFGIYRPAAPTNPIQNAFFDELRYGDTREAVEPR